MFPRLKTQLIAQFIGQNDIHKNVLIVDGVRQVGKTSAVHMALEGHNFLELNLEKQKDICVQIDATSDFGEFERLLKREFNFISGQGKILFIDEANESLRLGHYVRQMKEDWKLQTTILSGSMMNRLFRDKNIRIPVGRYENITIQPFSFFEFLTMNEKLKSDLTKYGLATLVSESSTLNTISDTEHKILLNLLQHYLNCGGLPEIAIGYLNNNPENRMQQTSKAMFLYLASLKDDFLKIFSQEYGNFFMRAIASVSNLQGAPYKKTALVKNNNRLADNILAVFEGWKFVYKMEQKGFATTDANSLMPKRYLFDVGLAKNQRESAIPAIHVIETLQAALREPLGGLIEQLVCLELTQNFPQLSAFKAKNYEIDFVLKWNNMAIPLECKASLKPNSNQYRGLDLYHKHYNNKLAFVVSLAPYSQVKRKGYTLIHVPAYALNGLEFILKKMS